MQHCQTIESFLTLDIWEERANKVLSHFHLSYPDEIDMYEICRRYGIKIKPLDPNYCEYDVDFSIEAFSVPLKEKRKGIIFLNPSLDPIIKKLCLAEEFCHLYAHHNSQLNMSAYQVNKMEQQAKRMSAYLLMPSFFLKDVFHAAADERVLISDIADYFLVTEEFAQYRLELIYKHRIDELLTYKGKLGSIEWLE